MMDYANARPEAHLHWFISVLVLNRIAQGVGILIFQQDCTGSWNIPTVGERDRQTDRERHTQRELRIELFLLETLTLKTLPPPSLQFVFYSV